jgi:hypothetical protein
MTPQLIGVELFAQWLQMALVGLPAAADVGLLEHAEVHDRRVTQPRPSVAHAARRLQRTRPD